MKNKITYLKKLFSNNDEEDRYYPVVPKRFIDYCDGDDMPPGLFHKKTDKFRFYFTKYPHLQSPSKCTLDMDGDVITKFSFKSFQIEYNSIQQKLFQRLYENVPSLDNHWFQKNDDFIRQLPLDQKFALVAITNKSQQHIQAYLKGEDTKLFKGRVRRWNPEIHGFLPIFFPLYQRYKKEIPKNITKKSSQYQYILKNICPKLTDQEIDECIVSLVKQIRHIFSICPRTTRKMTLWRGLRSDPTLSYPGFTSMSLNPFHTLNYVGKDCCLQKLTILPQTPLLFIGGLSSFKNELECVLPDNSQIYEIKKEITTIPIVLKMKEKCPPSTDIKRVIIQHAVVL